MMRSLFTGVTGLKQNQTKMDVLSNNIANVNTTGFKRGRAMFEDLFCQTIRNAQQSFGEYGGLNPMQVGLGAKLGSIDTVMEQGATETTGKNTDLAIEGGGFFVIDGGGGRQLFTRDGNFNLNSSYDLVMGTSGYKVQGWMATQNPKTGNLELSDTGTVPTSINTVRYLKKHAHQTNNVSYASNLDSSSDERDIEFGVNTLTYLDTAGNYQNLQFKFKKIDSQNWIWTAVDDTEGNVATGSIKTDANGKVIASTVDPAAADSTLGHAYFTYDPDGIPVSATATNLVNTVTNDGANGSCPGVIASGSEIRDETVSVIFDGGDPSRATSYRVVGSVRGFIGSGILGGTNATIEGGVMSLTAGKWKPNADLSFTITDNYYNPPRSAEIEFAGSTDPNGPTYTPAQIIATINNEMANNGLNAIATYDSVTNKMSITSRQTGADQSLTLNGVTNLSDFSGLGLLSRSGSTLTTPQIELPVVSIPWLPTSDVSFDVIDTEGKTATVTFPTNLAPGYTRGDITRIIQDKLNSAGLSATAQFQDNTLIIAGTNPGEDQQVTIKNAVNLDLLSVAPFQTIVKGTGASEPEVLADLTPTSQSGTDTTAPQFTFSSGLAARKSELWDMAADQWNPMTNVSFSVTDTAGNVATINFDGATVYSRADIVNTINVALAAQGVDATASFTDSDGDGTDETLLITGNTIGAGETLTIADKGGLNQLGLEIPTLWNMAMDQWDPSRDVSFTITDKNGHSALITFNDLVEGNNRVYNRGEILSEINSKLAANNVAAYAQFVDSNNDSIPDQLTITGSGSGLGELIQIGGENPEQIGLVNGTVVHGQAATSRFNLGGLDFTLNEGSTPWVPNDTMTMTTTAAKGQSESVKIYVPTPSSDELTFVAKVGETETKISGALNKGQTHTTSITVYDSLGSQHELVTTWEHTNKATHEWQYKISYGKSDPEIVNWLKDPQNGVVDPEAPTDEELERANDALISGRTGICYFTNQGKMDISKSILQEISMTPAGSNKVTIKLNMDLVTQFDSAFTTKARDQDGYEMGLLESIYFEQDGTIRGVYSNGQKQPIGQVALATFNNPGGLEKTGSNLYAFSPNSGLAIIGRPAEGERGSILAGSLEMSNVDIAEEFTNLIVTQRAFQASSRIITTSDEILQEVVNLKR